MSMVIACPACSAKMKIAKLPAVPSRVKCPHCEHPFTIGAGVKAGPPPGRREAREKDDAQQKKAMPLGLLLGIGGGSVLAVVGIIVAIIFMSSGSTPDNTPSPSPLAKGKDQTPDTAAQAEKERLAKLAREKADQEKAEKDQAAAEKAQKDKEKESADRKEADRLDKEFRDLMRAGDRAAAAKKWDEAVAAYEGALKIRKDDAEAAEDLAAARAARQAVAKNQEDAQRLKENQVKLLKQADDALTKKEYGPAKRLFELILTQDPDNDAAQKGFKDASAALDNDKEQKDKAAKFDAHMTAGKAALKAGKFPDAIREFTAAQRLDPFNPDPAKLVLEAEGKMGANKDADKRKDHYNDLMKLGTAAAKNQDYPEAKKFYDQALLLFPKDAVALAQLTAIQNALLLAQQQAGALFNQLMAQGQQAVLQRMYVDAIAIFRDLDRRFPRNDQVLAALANAERLYGLQLAYDTAILKGNQLYEKRFYREAVLEFEKALTIVPTDKVANGMLEKTRGRLEAEARNLKDFQRLVDSGQKALNERKYAVAAKDLKAAVRLMPNNDASPAVSKQGRYADAMDRGIKALNDKRTSDAVRHFQAALQELPNDRAASDALQQAQNADNRNSQEFTRLANDGFKSLKLQRWSEAASSLNKALKVSPDHKDAQTVGQYARYADAMGRGQLALKSGNRTEAINAFQAALAEFPQDNQARLGFNQAMAMKKKF
jgi:predicted Zn finger-like uncharacterized protein